MVAEKALECADAANEINRAIMDAINGGADRGAAESAVLKVMGQDADLGAVDSEPLWRLEECWSDFMAGAARFASR